MKSLREDIVFLCILLFLYALGQETMLWTSTFLVAFIWWYRHKDRSFLYVLVLCALIAVPKTDTSRPACTEAKVISVSSSSAILKSGNTKFAVYTDEILIPDYTYAFTGSFTEIKDSSGSFFSSSYSDVMKRKGVYWQLNPESMEIKDHRFTIRSRLFEKILERDEDERNILFRTVLNIRKGENEIPWLDMYGFSASGILLVLSSALRYFFDRKSRNRIMAVVDMILYVMLGYPLPVFMHVCKDMCACLPLSKQERAGISLITVLLVFPAVCTQAAFLIPGVFRIFNACNSEKTVWPHTTVMMLSSLLYNSVNPFISLCYRWIMKVSGLLWFYGLACILLHLPLSLPVYTMIQKVFDLLLCTELPGSIKGLGFVFFLMIVMTYRKKDHFDRYVLGIFLVFQCLGLFHPFMEISFINVGQGDAIYISGPFHMGTVLIDTGKPSAYDEVKTFLEAKGVRKLDTLIITHGDSDHSGNMEAVIEDFSPDTVITEHFTQCDAGKLSLYDLNTITNEDENQSSIMAFTNLNGMNILLCGDGDMKSEDEILKQYGNLDVDLLKAGHHGSKTSTGEDFLDTVRSELVIFSAGSPSLYHHPSSDTIQRLLKRHIPYLNTYEEGDITVLCIWKWNMMITASGKAGILSFSAFD